MLNAWITILLAILVGDGVAPTPGFLVQVPCTNICETDGCPNDHHKVRIDGSQDANTNDNTHICSDAGDCDDHTGSCGVSEEEDLVAVASPDALLFLKERYPKKVHVNMDREAVQLLDCAGRVSAHMPVSNALLRNLARVEF